ncbi:MAG: hypothetical protein ACXABO_09485 [Promethearchaeota archaeon]
MENRKLIGLILLVVGIVSIFINLLVIYPYINCSYAPWLFWLIAIIGGVGGILIYFNVKIFQADEG